MQRHALVLAVVALGPACDDGSPGDGPSQVRDAAVGVYHLADGPDTVNLELSEDGTFRTVQHGCDYDGGTQGTWSVDGEELVLVAAGPGDQLWREGVCPSACFSWPYIGPEGEGLSAAVEELRLTEQPDGSWAASFFDPSQGRDIVGQVVAPGGLCVTCGEGKSPCEDPFSHDQWAND